MPTQICRSIRVNGARCTLFALRGTASCYHHTRQKHLHRTEPISPTRCRSYDDTPTVLHPMSLAEKTQLNPYLAEYWKDDPGPLLLDLPPLEDHESIQLALSILVKAMAQNRIDAKRSTGLIYALQVASLNCRYITAEPSSSLIVRDTVTTEDGQQIAPNEDSESEIKEQAEQARLEQCLKEDEEDQDNEDNDNDDEDEDEDEDDDE